jgi:hypothetical protein
VFARGNGGKKSVQEQHKENLNVLNVLRVKAKTKKFKEKNHIPENFYRNFF